MSTLETLSQNESNESLIYELNELQNNVISQNENENEEEEKKEKPEKSFTFKPIAVNVGGSTIKNGEEWVDGITTKVEFAGGSKNTNLYGYIRKDRNKYAKGFNDGMELFGNESLKLGKNIDLNSKQFYRGNGSGKLLAGPQASLNTQIGKVGIGSTAGAYAAYDIIPGQENKVSGSGIVSVNISVEQKDGKKRTGDAFIHVGGIKGKDYENYSTYGEANLKTPNLLDSEKAGALCGWIFARYGGNVKSINLQCLGLGVTYEF